uniref:Uncharacterized protein n=1 Tax=viral metagenome TaxID=1070528 RepID=A0A6C0AN83_9ZZZZ
MYGSDVTNRNRAATLYINSVLKNQEFTSGKSIRIDRQKGGIDYQYLTNVEFGNIIDYTYNTYFPLSIKYGVNPNIFALYNLTQYDLTTGPEYGSPPVPTVIDEGSIPIDTGSRDFYFFGINYGGCNDIYWDSNNAITFGQRTDRNLTSISDNGYLGYSSTPAVLIGNYDRCCSALYYSKYFSTDNLFSVIVIIVYFSNYYTDTTNLDSGKYQIRLIRELNGNNRQWIEVAIISAPSSPGYSNSASVTFPSGRDASGNSLDSNSQPIEPTKNSPYDITDGTTFQNVCGSLFSTVSPQAGTSFLYQSDSNGRNWTFINNAYVPV